MLHVPFTTPSFIWGRRRAAVQLPLISTSDSARSGPSTFISGSLTEPQSWRITTHRGTNHPNISISVGSFSNESNILSRGTSSGFVTQIPDSSPEPSLRGG